VDRVGDTITIREVPCLGEFIRPAGADLCAGQIILRPGDLLIPARIGLLAALGLEDISVHPRPLVGLVSTGDELRPPGHPLSPGEIPDSNRPMLAALLADAGFEVAVSTHARDTPAALATALDATAGCDAVILTGGVSVGEHDHVRAALRDHGVTPDLWRVAVKPGKPFLFGRKDATTFFGLPGNPVSTYVTALLFVLPGLRRLAGATIAQARPQFFDLPTAERLHNPGDRPHYLRGTISQGEFHPASLQESHALASLARSTHLARIDANARIDPGESVACVALSGF
jgi:molybdopterin molybdotransferase